MSTAPWRSIQAGPQPTKNRGIMRKSHADWAGALLDFDRTVAVAPDDGDNYNTRGNARRDRGKSGTRLQRNDRG